MVETPLDLIRELMHSEAKITSLQDGLRTARARNEEIRDRLKPLFARGKTRTFMVITATRPVVLQVYAGSAGEFVSFTFIEPENPAALEWAAEPVAAPVVDGDSGLGDLIDVEFEENLPEPVATAPFPPAVLAAEADYDAA